MKTAHIIPPPVPADADTPAIGPVPGPTTVPTAPVPGASAGTPPGDAAPAAPEEIGGPTGPEPTRYGDWEQKGRCSDF